MKRVYKEGKPVSPAFPSIMAAAHWAATNGLAVIAAVPTPPDMCKPNTPGQMVPRMMTQVRLALDIEIKDG